MRRPRETKEGRLRRWATEEERVGLLARSLTFLKFRRQLRLEGRDLGTEIRDKAGVEAIVAAVPDRPKWLGKRHLREDIDRAIADHGVREEMFGQQWGARKKRLEELDRMFRKAAALLMKDDDPGKWISDLLPYSLNEDGERDRPRIVVQIEDIGSRLRRLRSDFITDKGASTEELRKVPARSALDQPREALIGDLAGIYLKWFRCKARSSGGSHGIVAGEDKPYKRPQSDFEDFVLAVCAGVGIKIAASSIPIHLSRARRSRVNGDADF